MIPSTRDALLSGRIVYHQPERGYRVGLEALLLAGFAVRADRRPPRRVVDLGAGPGAIGLVAATLAPAAEVTLVEVDDAHATLAEENVRENDLGGRVRVVRSDVRDVLSHLPRGGFDLVVSNPPWFDETKGRSPTDPRRARARMLSGDVLRAFVVAAKNLAGRASRVCFTFPATSIETLLAACDAVKLVPKRLRFVHPRVDEAANALLVECVSGKPGGLIVEGPLVVRGDGEAYTAEATRLLWGER